MDLLCGASKLELSNDVHDLVELRIIMHFFLQKQR
jgi:hypothetical protein